MKTQRGFTPGQLVSMFCQAAVQCGLIDERDLSFVKNLVLDLMQLPAPEEAASLLSLLDLSDLLMKHAVSAGLVEDSPEAKDRFSARLFGLVTPAPSAVADRFFTLYQQSPEAATRWFYQLCRDNDYIRTRNIRKNIVYTADSPVGKLEVTINLSKPEKDPRDIAAARRAAASGYPLCMLCKENPGYAGRPGFPARQNHRTIPLTLAEEPWHFQYSPYLYYDEHCIVFSDSHQPMHIDENSFRRMFDFVDAFPHYFIGANADLPIVGGSILTHDHFQGGRHVFPMEKAAPWFAIQWKDEAVDMEALRWPMTCLRLRGRDRQRLISAMLEVLKAWKKYSDPDLQIIARTADRHNTLNPILRKKNGEYLAYLLLRNNRTSDEHPLGIFHPHAQRHHIKKENIGLIEAMGTFILPGRLKEELGQVKEALLRGVPLPQDSPHVPWLERIRGKLPKDLSPAAVQRFIREEVAAVCYQVLSDTGVYPLNEAGKAGLIRFLGTLGVKER